MLRSPKYIAVWSRLILGGPLVAHILSPQISFFKGPSVRQEAQDGTELKGTIREEIRAIPRSVCKDVLEYFVLRLK